MKKHMSTIILCLLLITGLSLLLYPTVSDYWNSLHQSRAIADYTKTVAEIDNEQYHRMFEEADKYNKELLNKDNRWVFTPEEDEIYRSMIDVSGTGIMGYIEIPKIHCSLPIYHGTDERALQVAVGHIAGTSLPIGGESTHTVLSGHRGLPSAKLFTDLDRIVEKDTFMIQILDETLTYEVDQIRIVEPDEMQNLVIEPGKDLCTLVTCTPYGINTHRLLVRGHRIENQAEAVSREVRVAAEAIQIETVITATVLSVVMMVIILAWMLIASINFRRKPELDRKERD